MAHTLTSDVLPSLISAVAELQPTILMMTGLAGLLLGLALAAEPRAGHRLNAGILASLVAVAVAVGLYLAWQRLWLCDDAYISFRYARNLAEGHGLVFNIGERVEGYTNFLWTALLGVLGWVGLDIPYTALALNAVSFAAAVTLTALVVQRNSPKPMMIPFAALALGASCGFTTFASSGLETMPAAALVVAGMLASGRPALSGTLLILAALARPDHLLFWGAMGLALALEDVVCRAGPWLRRLQWRRYLAFTAPLVFLFVPWFLIRWHYYGDIFPNTYYAKSGGGTYYEQGLIYGVVWLATSGAWLWLPLFAVLAVARPRSPVEFRLRVFALVGVAVYGHYVVKVGGDFMLERFFIVLWPIVLASLELSLRFALKNGGIRLLWLVPAAVALGAGATPIAPIPDGQKVWHLAAEHSFYRVKRLAPLQIQSQYFGSGQALGALLGDLPDPPRLAAGSIGLVGYYSRLPISDRYGLINRRVAKRPIAHRGRPGHEKQATLQDILDDGADLATQSIWGDKRKTWTELRVGSERLHLVRELPGLRNAFAGNRKVRFPSRPTSVVLKAAALLSRAEALDEAHFLRAFIRTTDDLAPLTARLGSFADFDTGIPPDLRIEGDPPQWQDSQGVMGATGQGWLELDGPGTRKLTLPLDLRGATEVRFALGGSPLPGHRVELWSGGRRLFTATPTGGRLLKPVAWILRAPLDTAELVVIDEEAGPGTMLLLDGVHQPGPNDVRRLLAAHHLPVQRIGELLEVVAAELPAGDADMAALLADRLALHWTFEGSTWPEGAEVEGTAFGTGPVRFGLPAQQAIVGAVGGFLNSFHAGDAGTGTVHSLPFVLPAEGVVVRVAGGRDCRTVSVGIEVEGQMVSEVCGSNDERFRLRVLPARTYAGKPARLVVTDQATGPWGHILVDDVLVPQHRDLPPEDADLVRPAKVPRAVPL